jgi:hypothetical protein
MNLLNKILNWCNENNTEVVWFFIGFLFCDLISRIGQNEWWYVLYNTVIIVLMFATRKVKV